MLVYQKSKTAYSARYSVDRPGRGILYSMKFLYRFLFSLFSNLVAFIIAERYITGFIITGDLRQLLFAVAIFTVINTFIRPVLKLIFGPIIILTFGLGILIINAFMLYLLDKFSENVTIQGLEPLAYATLIISVVNLIVGVSARKTYED